MAEKPEPAPSDHVTRARSRVFLGHRFNFELGKGVLYNEADIKWLAVFSNADDQPLGTVGAGVGFLEGQEEFYGDEAHFLAMLPELSTGFWSRPGSMKRAAYFFTGTFGPILLLDHPDPDHGLFPEGDFINKIRFECAAGINIKPLNQPSLLLEGFFNAKNYIGIRAGVSLFKPAKPAAAALIPKAVPANGAEVTRPLPLPDSGNGNGNREQWKPW